MKEYKIEITLADNKKVYKTTQAKDEMQATDKIYEDYVKKNIKIYDIKIIN